MNLIFQIPTPIDRSNVVKKLHGIYIGGKSDAKNRSKLQQLGITHILNMTPEKDASIQSGVANYFEKNKTFIYKRIPIYDTSTTNLLSYAPQILSFIVKALNYGSILVHCQRGVSRSAAAVMLYLMNVQGMEFHVALNLIKERRECICPIPAFLEQLEKYELECKEKGLIRDHTAAAAAAPDLKRKSSSGSQKEESNQKGSTKKRKATNGPTWPSGPHDFVGEPNGNDSLGQHSTICSTSSSTRSDSMDHHGGGVDGTSKQVVDITTKVSNKDDEEEKKTTSTTATVTTGKSRTRQIGPSLPPGFKRG